jgi:hypothetical protein
LDVDDEVWMTEGVFEPAFVGVMLLLLLLPRIGVCCEGGGINCFGEGFRGLRCIRLARSGAFRGRSK